MPFLRLSLCVSLGVCLLSIGNAYGQTSGEETGRSDQEQKNQAVALDISAIIERFDKDADGVLNKQEREEVRAYFQKNPIGQTDVGAKKSLSRAEIIKRFDKDGDGRLSKEELVEARKQLLKMAGTQTTEATFNSDLLRKEFDKNNDGRIDAEEQVALRARIEEMRRLASEGKPIRPESEPAAKSLLTREGLLKRFDKDGDGQLDEQERETARNELLKGRKTGGNG